MLSMRGLKFSQHTGLQPVRVPIPTLTNYDDYVLVKVTYCGICGTDIDIIKGIIQWADNVILGHEITGTIHELGSNVSPADFPIGSNVVVCPQEICTKCYFCKKSYPNFCEKNQPDLNNTLGFGFDGGLAQYVRCHSSQCFRFNPSKIPVELSALVEPLWCVLHGFRKYLSVKKYKNEDLSDNILIFGYGIIGYLWSLVFYDYGFTNIYVIERAEKRQRIAEQCMHIKGVLGYDEQDENKIVFSGSAPKKFDIAIDCAGGGVQPLLFGYNVLAVGGTLISFGIMSDSASFTINPSWFVRKEITIIGTQQGKYTTKQGIETIQRFVEKGYVDLNMARKLQIVRPYAFDEYKEAIRDIKNGDVCKAMINVQSEQSASTYRRSKL